jgi:sigma-B regulation protein RsbU (phosphoserine phosphatase)
VSIGDATGHGIGAALLIAETRAYLRALALTHADPGTVVRLLNSRLAEDIGTGHFVTLLFARLSPPPCSLDYSNAGHWPGQVIDARGEVKFVLPSTNLPLGVDPGGHFPTGRPLALDPGDVVLLLSDGIIEAPSAGGRPFGMDRALKAVRAHRHESADDIVAALLARAREWSGTTQEDDMTAVVIKVLG